MDQPTEAELRAVVGPRADYYAAQWNGTGRMGNRAAFLFSGLWLPFRRMFRVTLIFYAAMTVVSVFEELVFGWLGYTDVPVWIDRLDALLAAVVCAAWGNSWYLAHVQRVIAETRQLGLPEDQHLKELTRRGGTRFFRALALVVLCFLALCAAAVIWDLLSGEPVAP